MGRILNEIQKVKKNVLPIDSGKKPHIPVIGIVLTSELTVTELFNI